MNKNLTTIVRENENYLMIFILVAISLLVFACGGSGGEGGGDATDSTPPDPITDLSSVPGTRATLSWTAPGDDGSMGTAASYDVRISESPINNDDDFENATAVASVPTPSPAGTQQQLTIPGLDINQTYYVAIKASDASGNVSPLSSSFSFNTNFKTKSLFGLKNGDVFGRGIAGGSDVTGDGLPDLIVGAPLYERVGDSVSQRGAIYIFPGGETIPDTQDPSVIFIEGLAEGEEFGSSVKISSDLNGDNCNDVIVGAPENSNSNFNKNGRVYIFYGLGNAPCPSSFNTNADVILQGSLSNERFGLSIAILGDISTDGVPDIIVGAPDLPTTNSNPGHAYIFFGGGTLTGVISASSADIVLTGKEIQDRFGVSLSDGRDINGDQIPEIVVGATIPSGITRNGAAYVFMGDQLTGDRFADTAEVIFSGAKVNDRLGWSLSLIEDLNADNLADLAVGTPFPDSTRGAVYVFYSGPGFVTKNVTSADVTLTGLNTSDQFGYSVADAGDVNLDGLNDLIVGANLGTSNSPSPTQGTGTAYIFYGGSGLQSGDASLADVELVGIDSDDEFGYSVTGIGDTNGDGYPEVAVGARFHSTVPLVDNGGVFLNR